MSRRKLTTAAAAVLVSVAGGGVLFVTHAGAATTVSTPQKPAGWSYAQDPTYPTDAPAEYSADEPRSGNGSLKFAMTTNPDYRELDHAADVPLADVNEISYEWRKASTPDQPGNANGTAADAYVIYIDDGGDADIPLVWEPIYNHSYPGNKLPLNSWQTETGMQNGLWTVGGPQSETRPLTPFATIQSDHEDATVTGYGIYSGSGTNGIITYVDNVSLNGTNTNFELDPPPATTVTVTVSPQGRKDQTFAHGGNAALGSVTVSSWVDIERTTTTTNGASTTTYRVRAHTRMAEVSKVLRDQITLARLGAPGRVLADNTTVVSSGTTEPAVVESTTPFQKVNAGTTCAKPVQLQARGTGDVRWTDGGLSQGLSVLSALTTSKVCLPA